MVQDIGRLQSNAAAGDFAPQCYSKPLRLVQELGSFTRALAESKEVLAQLEQPVAERFCSGPAVRSRDVSPEMLTRVYAAADAGIQGAKAVANRGWLDWAEQKFLKGASQARRC